MSGVLDRVSQGFLNAWHNRTEKFAVREVRYKRRYWNGSAFVYEANWKTLKMRDFKSVGAIVQQLDTIKLNEFRTSNLTVSLSNDRNLWSPHNVYGYFGADATATDGYSAYKTLFQVYGGYELADGTEELICKFTGFLTDYNLNNRDGYIEMTLTGYELKLQSKDAQDTLSTAFTDEAMVPAAGDGVTKDFYTTSQGVAYLLSNGVKWDGVSKLEFIEYTISNTGKPGEGAKVSFVDAPAPGVVPTASGRCWSATQKIEVMVAALCETAGILEADRAIESVIFSNGVNGYKQLDTQAEWEDGATLQNITTGIGDRIAQAWLKVDDFAAGTMEKWVQLFKFGPAGNSTASAASGALVVSTTSAVDDLYSIGVGISNLSKHNGTWSWRMAFSGTLPNPELIDTGVWFMYAGNAAMIGRVYGYGLVFTAPDTVVFRKRDSGGKSDTPVASGLSGAHNFRVTRDADGNFEIFMDGVSRATTSDTDFYSGSPAVCVFSYYTGCSITFDDFWVSDGLEGTSTITTDPALYTSKEFDILSVPKAWGVIERSETLNDGAIAYYVASHAAAGQAYTDGEFVLATPQIQAELRQHFKIRVAITPGAGKFFSPWCNKVKANFSTSEIFVALANFMGMTCYAAIQKLAKLCNYEWGFNGDGSFFFRSKSASTTPLITLTQKDVVYISSIRPGWSEIVNVAKIPYGGDYYREYNSSTLPETSPTSQEIYGDRIKSDTATDFLLANDADLASGVAQVLHDDNYRARLRVSLTFRLIPFLRLSDTIQVDYADDPLQKDYILGDQLQKWGAQSFGEAGNEMLFRDKLFKVVGIKQREDDEMTDANLEEII